MCKAKTLAWSPHSTQCGPGPLQPGCRVLGAPVPSVCPSPGKVFPYSQSGCSLSSSSHLVSESSQPTKRCSLPSSSLPFHSSSNPLVMWGIIGAGSPRRAKTSSFYQSEAPCPPWVETAARVHFYLYPLQGSFFVHWPVVPLVHHPTCRHLSHLSSWVLPGPDAGFPNMPCWSEDAEFILPESTPLTWSQWLSRMGWRKLGQRQDIYKDFGLWLKAGLAMWCLADYRRWKEYRYSRWGWVDTARGRFWNLGGALLFDAFY